ncbi:MAG: glyoxalase family protein [Ilumatobacteraceae bacterium]|jgi:PhnB protein|nr:glyoxalase family protein [Ilumatobacteraceae bacterium]
MSEQQHPDASGTSGIRPHLVCAGAAEAIDFYTRAFGAVEMIRLPMPDGKLAHAAVEINGGTVLLVDENAEYDMRGPLTLGGSPVTLHMVVPDVDASFARAVDAGATVVAPVTDQFWGDRYGVVKDPFGHLWSIATPGKNAPRTSEELAAAMRGDVQPDSEG